MKEISTPLEIHAKLANNLEKYVDGLEQNERIKFKGIINQMRNLLSHARSVNDIYNCEEQFRHLVKDIYRDQREVKIERYTI